MVDVSLLHAASLQLGLPESTAHGTLHRGDAFIVPSSCELKRAKEKAVSVACGGSSVWLVDIAYPLSHTIAVSDYVVLPRDLPAQRASAMPLPSLQSPSRPPATRNCAVVREYVLDVLCSMAAQCAVCPRGARDFISTSASVNRPADGAAALLRLRQERFSSTCHLALRSYHTVGAACFHHLVALPTCGRSDCERHLQHVIRVAAQMAIQAAEAPQAEPTLRAAAVSLVEQAGVPRVPQASLESMSAGAQLTVMTALSATAAIDATAHALRVDPSYPTPTIKENTVTALAGASASDASTPSPAVAPPAACAQVEDL